MNVFVSTPAIPTVENPNRGVFVVERIRNLIRKGHHACFIEIHEVHISSFIKKILYIPILIYKNQNHELCSGIDFYRFHYLTFRIDKNNLLPKILAFLSSFRKCDILHIHFLWNANNTAKLAKIINKNYIITAHGSDVHETMVQNHEQRNEFLEVLHNADHVIFVSNFICNTAKSCGYKGLNYSVIYNGYNPDNFYCKDQKSNELIIGFVGNLYPVKRADQFPEIFELILKELPEARFILVGMGDSSESVYNFLIEEFTKRNIIHKVTFTGLVSPSEVGNYMRQFTVMIFPSRNEGLPCSVIEARACGTPVIGSSNGGVPEAIENDGVVVEEGDNFNIRFAKAVIAIIKNYNRNSKEIAMHVSHLTWDGIMKQELDLYKKIIGE